MTTPALELIILRPEHRAAYRLGRDRLAGLLKLTLPEGWPQFPEFFESDAMPDLGDDWPAFFFVDRRIGGLVGNGGFTGAPDAAGHVEIGYEIAPAHRGQGYATRAAQALVDWARARPAARAMQAQTLAESNASNAVLRKLGMRFIAELPNEEVGKVWLWRLDLQPDIDMQPRFDLNTAVAARFDDEVRFLQQLVRIPTDTPPGNNAPHAERTAELLTALGFEVERHAVPAAEVQAAGMQSITNLIVRHRFSDDGPTIALNAHGDVVPPGEGWTHDPYGAEIVYPSPTGTSTVPQGDAAGLGSGPAARLVNGKLYGRASAVSKSDFATYTFALLALKNSGLPLKGAVELHFTYDEEFGGELGPGWLLAQGLTKPDYLIAAGFSYQVVTAHNGCLQMEVTLHGLASHAAYPSTGVDALQAATKLLTALYAHNDLLRTRRSEVPGITHPYLNVGRIEGGSNTNVVPGKVVLKLDRRMIPEEDPAAVEAEVRALIEAAVAQSPGVRLEIKRLLLANSMKPLPGAAPLVAALQKHGQAVFGEAIPTSGTPLYTDVRLYTAHGIPAAIYGAGPRTVLESNAKRADEHLVLDDLKRATQVVARALAELLAG